VFLLILILVSAVKVGAAADLFPALEFLPLRVHFGGYELNDVTAQ
jgi:hypothetical protein